MSCQCFNLCDDGNIINFTRYLPIVDTKDSPWNKYLNVVYGSHPHLPYDVQHLEAVYPGLLPTRIDRCTGYKEFASMSSKHVTKRDQLPQCDSSTCSQWLSKAARPMSGRPTIIKSIRTSNTRLQVILKSNPMSVFLAVQKPNRTESLSNTWTEVVRIGSWTGEANNYGCWFWKARGPTCLWVYSTLI